MTIKDRILSYLKEQGISREDFYKATGLSASNFKGAALNSELGGEKIVRILSTYKHVSPDWLLLGEGSMLRSEQIPPCIKEPTVNSSLNEESFIYKMYQAEKAEKDKMLKDKEAKIDQLTQRIMELSSELAKVYPEGLAAVKSASIKNPSLKKTQSVSSDNAGSQKP